MIYTSGIVTDLTREETLEELQDNKLTTVCEKVRRHHIVFRIALNICYHSLTFNLMITFWTLAADGVLSLRSLRRTMDARSPVSPSLRSRLLSETLGLLPT